MWARIVFQQTGCGMPFTGSRFRKKGEYYLTDTVELAVKDGLPVQALVMDDMVETIGINTRVHLAEAEAAMRRRINEEHMLAWRDPD